MLESGRLARREPALPIGGEGAVRVLSPATRLSLRVKGVAVPPRDPSPAGGGGRCGAPDGGGAPHPDTPHPGSGLRPGSALPSREGSGASLVSTIAGLPINRCAIAGAHTVARLGPDEWLILGPETDPDALAAEIAAALAGRFHALIDVSHRQVALAVSGPDAVAILNSGCPLDLHEIGFPPGSATRTLLGKAEIVLLRPSEAPEFRVECWRSFATYVHGFLTEAALDV